MTTNNPDHIELTDAQLAEWEALAERATGGPWYTVDPPWANSDWVNAGSEDPHGGSLVCDCQAQHDDMTDDDEGDNAISDAAFIAAARTAVPALIAEVRRLRACIARVKALQDGYRNAGDIWDVPSALGIAEEISKALREE